jgi:hypothetical protein
MKITKQRLKEIIKEELSPELVDVAVLAARNNDLDAFEKNVLELLEIGINDPRASQITRISGELMEKVHDADLSHEALGKQLLKLKLIPDLQRMLSRLSENKPTMKITKQRLREIIKEELSEGLFDRSKRGSIEEALGEYLRLRQNNDPASVDELIEFMGQNRRTFEIIIQDLTNKLGAV